MGRRLLFLGFIINALVVVPVAPQASFATSVRVPTAHDVLVAINGSRTGKGLTQLVVDSRLDAAAHDRLTDMVRRHYFSHATPEGTYVWETLVRGKCAYRMAAENLASGFSDESAMEESWMRSASHRANILNPGYKLIGIAVS